MESKMKHKLDMNQLRESFKGNEDKWSIGTLQVVAYIAAGGGMIGRMYAEQPADAYRDIRAGKGPYNNKDMEKIRLTLVAMAEAYGLNPHHLPCMPDFHNCGIF